MRAARAPERSYAYGTVELHGAGFAGGGRGTMTVVGPRFARAPPGDKIMPAVRIREGAVYPDHYLRRAPPALVAFNDAPAP